MKINARTLTVICAFIASCKLCSSKKYTNYTLVSAVPRTAEEMNFLVKLESQKYMDLMFWERPYKLDKEVIILISPLDYELFKERANHYQLKFNVKTSNIQREFDAQIVGNYRYLRFDTFLFNDFHNLQDIYQWMSDLSQNNRYLYLETIGKSAQGRDIYAMRVNKNNAVHKVIVEGGIHGHEWLSVAFVTFLLNELIFSEKSQFRLFDDLANKYEWLVIPVVNPDGYHYTHEMDRLWRKNRGKYKDGGVGVDLNRNFNHSFCTYASSRSPKDDNYCGESALSEPETRALADFIESNRKNLKYYFSIHAFGQMIIVPYEDRIQHVENFSEMENYARQAINEIYAYNRNKYRTGSIYDTKGTRVSGTSTSWVKKVYRVPYVYTWYLRDSGDVGHAVSSQDIVPSCQEAIVGVTKLMTAKPKYVRALYVDNRTVMVQRSNSLLVLLGVLLRFK